MIASLSRAAVVALLLMPASACNSTPSRSPRGAPADSIQGEADEIHQLLAYAIVGAHHETGFGGRRGHNIGAVLVAPVGVPVWWELNSNFGEDSPLEHAETRLLRGYISHQRTIARPVERLSGYTVYTTLEPCVMCTGTMIMASVDRVVYGQHDTRWGGGAERLSFDSRLLGRGFAPYPRSLQSVPTQSSVRMRLEQSFRQSGDELLTRWLDTTAAKDLFRDATDELREFKPRHDGNVLVLRRAQEFYRRAAAGRESDDGGIENHR